MALHVEKLEKIEKMEKTDCTARDIQETRAYIEKAVTASHKMAAFMENIRRHVQRDVRHDRLYDGDGNEGGDERTCDIRNEANFVIDLLAYKAREAGVVVTVEGSAESDFQNRYYANPFYFHQIFQNLIANAIEAHALRNRENKTVRIKINEKRITAGMTKEVQERLFEPFFTTKQSSHNTGIGLHTVKSIVEEKLKGKINVESAENVGTTFIIDLL